VAAAGLALRALTLLPAVCAVGSCAVAGACDLGGVEAVAAGTAEPEDAATAILGGMDWPASPISTR
jgi:hypothetical protein